MSGSSKFARGGGRGPTRMVAPPPPPLGRGMIPLRRGAGPGKDRGRTEDTSSKGRGFSLKGGVSAATREGAPFQEENFQMISCKQKGIAPHYAMAIRLTPGLLETLKRVDELGEATTMKFGVTAAGHVIKVGEEEYPFSYAPEKGQLCEIFEEQKRGNDGHGILVESGPVWRKLSIVRTLSTTEKDRVKARSVEAERLQKSRKAIILDHNNSVMNNKVAASGEVNGRHAPIIKPKKEPPPKKRKMMPTNPVVPPVSAFRPKSVPSVAEKPPLPENTNTQRTAKPSTSSSPEEPVVSSRIPPSQGNVVPSTKARESAVEEAGTPAATKPSGGSQKDKAIGSGSAAGGEAGSSSKPAVVISTSQLRDCLISIFVENPKGMTIKAVEKAFAEAMPNVRPHKKQVEKGIKAIAFYQAPGKYMLKEGLEKGTFAKPSPGSGSSPETVPVDSPPLADSPALVECAPDALQDTGVPIDNGGGRSIAVHQDPKKADVTTRNASFPVQRGGESAVSRAIRKAGEMVRGNAERSQFAGQSKGTKVETAVDNHQNSNLKESTAPDEADLDQVSVGGDESPVLHSPKTLEDGRGHEVGVNANEEDGQKLDSLDSHEAHEANPKQDNSDGSDSSSESGTDSDSDTESDSDSESGSATGSSDSESDQGSSSSGGSEEENMDEDVDIISDDEDKAVVDMTDASKQKQKYKDQKHSLERQEVRVQKHSMRSKDHPKKQKQKGADPGMTPSRSDDVDVSDGEPSKEKSPDSKVWCPETGELNVDVDVDIDDVSSDGEIRSPRRQGNSINELREDPSEILQAVSHKISDEGNDGKDSVCPRIERKTGSESDHSIEEYETRAENSGARGARVFGDQKEEAPEPRIEVSEIVPSPQGRVPSGSKLKGPTKRIEREIRSEAEISSSTSLMEPVMPNVIVSSKEHSMVGNRSAQSELGQRSLLGTPPFPRNVVNQSGSRTSRVGPKNRGTKAVSRFTENVEPVSEGPRPMQHTIKLAEPSSKFLKSSDSLMSASEERETAGKILIGKTSEVLEEPGLIGRGQDWRENSGLDVIVKSTGDDAPLQWLVDGRQNRETGLLAQPSKVLKQVGRSKESDQSNGLGRDKDASKPVRDARQTKKLSEKHDVLVRGDLPERAGPATECGEKLGKDSDVQRKLSRDGEAKWKSPKEFEPTSKTAIDNEIHMPNSKDIRKTEKDAFAGKEKESKLNSDLELGELRDLVAGEEMKTKEITRNENPKWRESSDLSSRQPSSKTRISPDKEKKTLGKQLPDAKKPSMGDGKKLPSVKKDLHLQKAEVPISQRETGRPAVNAPSVLASQDIRLEYGSNRVAADATKVRASLSDAFEKQPEVRIGKRLAEDGGHYESGRPSKRLGVDPSQVFGVVGHGESDSSHDKVEKQEKSSALLDTAGKVSVLDTGKSVSTEGWNRHVASGSKGMGERDKQNDGIEKEIPDKRGPHADIKQKTTAGLLGPGAKRETQMNGKKKPVQVNDARNLEFFKKYEKKVPEMKDPILHHEQYLEYRKEYNEKYPVYVRLHEVLSSDKEDFENFSQDITSAKLSDDKKKLGSIYGKVERYYLQCRKRFKRMQVTFNVLHEELRVIKQRCKEYTERLGHG